MSKWEDKYEQYKDGGIDNIIKNKTAQIKRTENRINKENERRDFKNSEEYGKQQNKMKELEEKKQKTVEEKEKLEKVKERMPQITNVIEYRNKLKDELKDLKQELKARGNLEESKQKIHEAEKQIAEFQNEYEELSKQLRDPNLKPEKRAEIEGKQKEINEKMAKAQDDRQETEENLNKDLKQERKLSNLSNQELEEKIFNTQTRISKCNLVAHNLLNGLSWEEIDMKLEDWKDKKFTSKDGKISEKVNLAKGEREDSEKIEVIEFTSDIKDPNEDNNIISSEEKLKENEKRMRRKARNEKIKSGINKVKNWFRNIFGRKQPELLEDKKEDKEPEQEDVKKPKDDFREYIKFVAEYGEDADKKLQEARKAELKEKFGRTNEGAKMTEKGRESLSDIDEKVKELQAENEARLRAEAGDER